MTMTLVLLLLNLCLFFANWYIADKDDSKFSYADAGMIFNGLAVVLLVFKIGGWL